MSKKRGSSAEEELCAAGNEGRRKMGSGGAVVPWDQHNAFEIVADACVAVLRKRRDGTLAVRGLVDALNREVTTLTKRGERYVPRRLSL